MKHLHLALILLVAILSTGCATTRPGTPPQAQALNSTSSMSSPAPLATRPGPGGPAQGPAYINPFSGSPPAAMLTSDPAGCLLLLGGYTLIGVYDLALFCAHLGE